MNEFELNKVIEKSEKWLLKNQDKKSGGWASLAGGTVNTLNSAEAILALLDGDIVKAGHKQIQKGVKFLLKRQITKGVDKGAWPREALGEKEKPLKIADMVRTSFVLQALIRAGIGIDEKPIKYAVDWLLSIMKKNNGWGFRKGGRVKLMPTCFALLSLLEAYNAGMNQYKDAIIEGLEFLVDKYHKEGGFFGNSNRLVAVHTIYAVITLQAARRSNLSLYTHQEKEAVDWLLRHPDEARKLVEERFKIDPSGRLNYGFLFVTDSLLIKALTGSDHKEHRNSELAHQTMLNLKDKLDESGGFYGYRVFSWSTAKVLSALRIAGSQFQKFPKRQPEYRGIKSGKIIFVFSLMLAVCVVGLTIYGKFQLIHAVMFMFLMLALLLASGLIGEKTFKELVQGFQSIFKKK